MNSWDKIVKVLSNEPVDQRPRSAVLSLYGAKLTSCDLVRYYSDPLAYFEGQVAIVEKFDPDIIFTPVAIAKEAEAWGSKIKYFKDAPPNRIVTIRTIDEIDQLVVPEINNSIYENYFLNSTRMLSEKYKGIKAIGAVWSDPLDLLVNIVGPELFMELLLFNREKFNQIMDKLTVFSVVYANALLEAGADFLINFLAAGNVSMITRQMATEIAYPILKKNFEQINGNILIYHGGYKIEPYIDIYKDLPNLMGFAIDSADNLVTSYEKINKTQILVGNISGPNLDRYTPAQIKEICQSKLNKMKHANRFILMTTSADIPFDATEDQVAALFKCTSQDTLVSVEKKGKVIGIACGIFKLEIEHLVAQKRLNIPFVYLDSTLHMKPETLKTKLDASIAENLEKYEKVLLVYGDCHPYMLDNYDPKKVYRVDGINCCRIVLGNEKYRKLRKEGAFFVFNEWAHRWKDIFVNDIGLTDKIAPLFMNAMHKSIIYLDTESDPVPIKILEEMSAYFNLPYEVLKINLDIFNDAINNTLSEVLK